MSQIFHTKKCLIVDLKSIFSFVVLGPASAPLKEVTLVTHSAMKRASVHVKGMSLVPSVLSVILASMAWKARTHMVANTVSVMDTLAFVK